VRGQQRGQATADPLITNQGVRRNPVDSALQQALISRISPEYSANLTVQPYGTPFLRPAGALRSEARVKPVTQTVTDIGKGNCFAACLASLLHLECNEVPNFIGDSSEDDNWFAICNEWLAKRG
jgi:hypothetical protein